MVGAGYIGLEMTEVLVHRGLDVSLVELESQVMGPIDPEMATPLHEHLRQKGVDLCLNMSVTSIKEQDGQLGVLLSTGRVISCGLVILAVGVRPEMKLAAEAGLTIGSRKGIVVDDHMRTSDPDIYAVGDAVEVQDLVGGFAAVVPLAGPANRQGRIAAINALGGDAIYERTQGTAICKVFDLAVGMTGLSEKALKRAGLPYEKVYVHPASHAGYYPGATQMSLKLLFDPQQRQGAGCPVCRGRWRGQADRCPGGGHPGRHDRVRLGEARIGLRAAFRLGQGPGQLRRLRGGQCPCGRRFGSAMWRTW